MSSDSNNQERAMPAEATSARTGQPSSHYQDRELLPPVARKCAQPDYRKLGFAGIEDAEGIN